MMMDAARVAVVTGANKGIGLSIVKLLCLKQPDWIVYLTARDADQGSRAADGLNKKHAINPRFHQLDVESPQSIASFRDYLKSQHPQGISVLINNAGAYLKSSSFDRAKWKTMFSVNYFGPISVCEHLFPLLTKDAKVVMVSSRLAQVVFSQLPHRLQDQLRNCLTVDDLSREMQEFLDLPEDKYFINGWSPVRLGEMAPKFRQAMCNVLPYGLSKMALHLASLIYQMQFEAEESRVAVNACTPGSVKTDMNEAGTKRPDDGADVVVYLATLPPASELRGMFIGDGRTVEDMFLI